MREWSKCTPTQLEPSNLRSAGECLSRLATGAMDPEGFEPSIPSLEGLHNICLKGKLFGALSRLGYESIKGLEIEGI